MHYNTTSLSSFFDRAILSLFPTVTTHLNHNADQTLSTQLFPHDYIIAALAISFNRYTITSSDESRAIRIVWSLLLGGLAWQNYDYWILILLHLVSFSHVVMKSCKDTYYKDQKLDILSQVKLLAVVSIIYSFVTFIIYSFANPQNPYSTNTFNWIMSTTIFSNIKGSFLTSQLMKPLVALLPVDEITAAYELLTSFINPSVLNAKIAYLAFVTFHIQTGMGFLGIEFLRNEQNRKNALIKIEDEVKKMNEEQEKSTNGSKTTKDDKSISKDPSKKFRQSAGPFILYVALPYMAQIVFYGAVNMFAFHCFRDDIHRTIRLNDLFDDGGHRFVATSNTSTLSPGSYATNSETVVSTVYDIFNQNLFSLPKLMLLPQIIAKQPMLLMKITPLILLSDYIKSNVVATITTETEKISKKVNELEALRNKIEEYDLKNSELIQRSGFDSIAFTEERWVDLTEEIQEKQATVSIMKRSKMYFQWLQRHFIMMALVDCALAKLIAVGKLVASDIFVYARAIEDFIGFIFMRSRAESELASMMTSIKVLKDLKQIWNESSDRNLLKCSLDEDESDELVMKGLSYSRGSASVMIEDIKLSNGIYAVTGANGSGKSTLFRLITACDTNRKSIDMDNSIIIKTRGVVKMPSKNVVEISQNFYWPLNTAPIDWIYHTKTDSLRESDREIKVSKLVSELRSLKLYPETQPGSDLRDDLTSLKDDWFSDLSGGQKSKVELVRKVFLEDRCPKVLLIDETFAPLDPASKSLVMQRIKDFCVDSIVLVIYHADVKEVKGETQEASDDACVQSSNFFDANLHVQDGFLSVRSVCNSDE